VATITLQCSAGSDDTIAANMEP